MKTLRELVILKMVESWLIKKQWEIQPLKLLGDLYLLQGLVFDTSWLVAYLERDSFVIALCVSAISHQVFVICVSGKLKFVLDDTPHRVGKFS